MSQISFPRRQLFAGAGALAIGGLLAACSSPGGSPSPSATKRAAAGSFTLWNYASQLTDAINTGFIPAHPKITTNVTQIAQADLQNRLLVSLTAGSGLPDAATLTSRTSDQFLKSGAFQEWTSDQLAAYGHDFENALISYDGKVYGLPTNDGRLGMWVNRAALDKYGIDPATFTTFDAMAEAGRKLNTDSKGASKLFMVPNGVIGADYFSVLLATAGGNWWNSKGVFQTDQSTALDVMTFLVGMVKDDSVQITDWSQPTFFTLIKNQQLTSFGMNYTIGASNLPKNVPEQSGQWEMLKWPTWKKGAAQKTPSYGTTFFGILKDGNVGAAQEFASWWYTAAGLPYLSALGSLAYVPAKKLDLVQKKNPYFGGQKVIADMVSQPMVVPNYYNWSQTEQALSYALDQALLRKISPSQAIDSVVSALKKVA